MGKTKRRTRSGGTIVQRITYTKRNRFNHLHEKEQVQSLHANALIKKEKTIKYIREEVATSSNALRKRSLTLVNSVQHLSSLHKDEKNTVKELSTRVLELGKINDGTRSCYATVNQKLHNRN